MEKSIFSYEIIQAETADKLNGMVQNRMIHQWKPYGPPICNKEGERYVWYQPMVLYQQ